MGTVGHETGLTGKAEGKTLTDTEAMDLIFYALNGVEWSPDTLDEIAELVELTGREISDIDF